MNYSIPTSVAVVAWAGLLALVTTYTAKAYSKTAKNLPEGDFTPGVPDSSFGGGDFAPTDPGFG